jgi:hypothetical protein
LPTIKFDDRSFFVDDRRLWLSSGSIHYFRVPRQLWRDRVLKAKRAGLNCIDTYVPWNYHEMQEGRWDFSGEKDVGAFVRLCGEMGMYVILRPGPYICAEWDFGGLPAWLSAKSGIAYRTHNAVYMHYFDKYLRQLLPRLAELQATRGGPILLIQNENEYFYTHMPERLQYCEFINQLFKRSGFDIPIITCNQLSQPKVPDTIECLNAYDDAVSGLKRLRSFQPNAPLLASEFWGGWFDWWGHPHNHKEPRQVARKALEMLGCGCQINHYMFHGGTNFAFWGSRLSTSESAYQTTSYDYDAPIAEGGGLTPKYYLLKLVNFLARHFGRVLSQARAEGPALTLQGGTQAFNLTGPGGNLSVITNNGEDRFDAVIVSLPDGRKLNVSLGVLGATAIAHQVRLPSQAMLDYSNLMPLGLLGEGNLVLHGPAGFPAVLSLDGSEFSLPVPAGNKVEQVVHHEQKVFIINSELAQRAWEVDGALVLGPEWVGETAEDVIGGEPYAILSPGGELAIRKPKPATRSSERPQHCAFTRVAVCDEPINEKLPWQRIAHPAELSALGAEYGYGWYRIDVAAPAAARRELFLPDCQDRAELYLNGESLGTWCRGQDAARKTIKASFRKGKNLLVVLADNLGRPNWGQMLGQPKGLYGHIYDAKALVLPKFKLHPGGEFNRRMVPRMLSHLAGELEKLPLVSAETVFRLPAVRPVHLSFANLPFNLAIWVNGRQVLLHAGFSGNYGQVTLANELIKGPNRLTVLAWNLPLGLDLDGCFCAHLLSENLTASAQWSFRTWEPPQAGGRLVGKSLPAWYSCSFKHSPSSQPLFLNVGAARKGQIYLNGRNLGRFWNIGPQQWYYLPEPYLNRENELLVFEEHGNIPSGSRLEFRPGGPYHVPGGP